MSANNILYYIHDPMCSWCWGFRPVHQHLNQALPTDLQQVRLLGGLAKDSDTPMPDSLQLQLQGVWKRIEETIPGTVFNYDFWRYCHPRRSTWPACRAVLAAREQGAEFDTRMTLAIQKAYYLEAKNPSDDSQLIELAKSLALDHQRFAADLNSPEINDQLAREIYLARKINCTGFPSLVVSVDGRTTTIALDYHSHSPMLREIQALIA